MLLVNSLFEDWLHLSLFIALTISLNCENMYKVTVSHDMEFEQYGVEKYTALCYTLYVNYNNL